MEYVTIFESDDNHLKSSDFCKMIRHFAKKIMMKHPDGLTSGWST